jgi:hypothetical protein
MGSWILLIDLALGIELCSRVPPKENAGELVLLEDYSTVNLVEIFRLLCEYNKFI